MKISCFVILLAALGLSACVSSKYKSADKDRRSPIALNLTGAAMPGDASRSSPFEVTVQSIIVFHGPGSWKREAYWDEYIVTVANRGATSLTAEAATLTDFRGVPCSAGTDPWELESQSHRYESEVTAASGAILEIGNGAATPAEGLLAASADVAGAYYGVAAVGMALTATPVGLPVYAVAAWLRSSTSKQRITEQFHLRRLKLPLTVAPGQTVQGSLFFRISPGPQRLTLGGRAGETPVEVVIGLTPLKGLHLTAPVAATAAPPSATPPSTTPAP